MPKLTEADRLEAFIHALAGNLRAHGIPMPSFDLEPVRSMDPNTIAASAAWIASRVHEHRRLTFH